MPSRWFCLGDTEHGFPLTLESQPRFGILSISEELMLTYGLVTCFPAYTSYLHVGSHWHMKANMRADLPCWQNHTIHHNLPPSGTHLGMNRCARVGVNTSYARLCVMLSDQDRYRSGLVSSYYITTQLVLPGPEQLAFPIEVMCLQEFVFPSLGTKACPHGGEPSILDLIH